MCEQHVIEDHRFRYLWTGSVFHSGPLLYMGDDTLQTTVTDPLRHTAAAYHEKFN